MKSFHNSIFLITLISLILSSCKRESYPIVIDPDIKKLDNLGNVTTETSYIGEHSIQLHPQSQYGLSSGSIKVKGGDRFHSKMYIKTNKSNFNLSASSSWGEYYMNSFLPRTNENWKEINLYIQIPDSIESGEVQFYIHYFGQDTIYVDNHVIQKNPKFNFNSFIPDYIQFPLTIALLQELNINLTIPTIENFKESIELNICNKVFDYYGVKREDFKNYLSNEQFKFNEISEYLNRKKQQTVNLKRNPIYNGIAGYTDKIIYDSGQDIIVHTISELPFNVVLTELKNGYTENVVRTLTKRKEKEFKLATSELEEGIYCVNLIDLNDTFKIPLIINDNEPGDVIILAPVTTWHAYNDYSGKSFYRNKVDSLPVYHLSTKRPLLSVDFDSTRLGHDIYILRNIYKFFDKNFNVKIYPDYYLESNPEVFTACKTIILAQHCEYFSSKMFSILNNLSESKNIISLGGNQCYYKISWHENYTVIENRKDGTFHNNSIMPGGVWRSHFTSEAKYLGVAYTDAGYATFSPYQIQDKSHWIYKGLENIENGQLFGEKGIDGRGLSGDELDKRDKSSPTNTIIVAKGLNPHNGGAEIAIIERGKVGTLSTGSITSGSGLISDHIFTTMIENFMKKYH